MKRHSECGENERTKIAKVIPLARDRIPSGASSAWSFEGIYRLGSRQAMNPCPHQYHVGKRRIGSDCVR